MSHGRDAVHKAIYTSSGEPVVLKAHTVIRVSMLSTTRTNQNAEIQQQAT